MKNKQLPGLLKGKSWGVQAAQMANILWIYSLISTWSRDLYMGAVSPGNILFLPFALFAVWSLYYLLTSRSAIKEAV